MYLLPAFIFSHARIILYTLRTLMLFKIIHHLLLKSSVINNLTSIEYVSKNVPDHVMCSLFNVLALFNVLM